MGTKEEGGEFSRLGSFHSTRTSPLQNAPQILRSLRQICTQVVTLLNVENVADSKRSHEIAQGHMVVFITPDNPKEIFSIYCIRQKVCKCVWKRTSGRGWGLTQTKMTRCSISQHVTYCIISINKLQLNPHMKNYLRDHKHVELSPLRSGLRLRSTGGGWHSPNIGLRGGVCGLERNPMWAGGGTCFPSEENSMVLGVMGT